ncbi:hypothetical protein VCHENC02_0825, partial [Vibrio harveyi]
MCQFRNHLHDVVFSAPLFDIFDKLTIDFKQIKLPL